MGGAGALSHRVAIVAGLRTPFARRGGGLGDQTALQLGVACVRELLARSGLAREIERVVFGQVVPSLHAPIATGDLDAGVCGGTDSVSDVPIAVSRPLARALIANRRARGLGERVRAFASLGAGDLRVEPPTLVERTTGLTMGEHAELMGAEASIERAAQDAFAARSHARAAAAWADGRLAAEVMRMPGIERDELVRPGVTAASLGKLAPLFGDRGTITAGNASPLSDGASAAILMRDDKARALGLRPLAWIRAAATTAVDPHRQLLGAPVTALPRALERAGVTLADLTLLDLHEAFAAQVLAVAQALGGVDWERTNVMGGSIALGHPFAATGTRQLVQVANELGRRGGGVAAITACAAGGLGAAIVIESP